jgi:excisionase family DNA binding protein
MSNTTILQIDPRLPSQSHDEGDERFLTTPEAASYLRVSKSYLDKLRVYGGGPKFLRFGKRKILYRKSDLDLWAAERRFGSTSEYASDRISPQDDSELPANTSQQRATKALGYNSG